ncbi:MAG: gliding motility-associated C-terminal domain-containing protein [Bacteroidota bacterium]
MLDVPGFLYQWYKNGAALVGETMPQLSQMYGNGTYEVRMEEPGVDCRVSEAFNYVEPDRTHVQPLTICEGEEIRFGPQWLSQSGSYIDTFKTDLGCDSIVRLELVVNVDEPDTQRVKVYPGEAHRVGTIDYYNPGQYSPTLVNQYGCDSTVYVELSFYDLFPPTGFTPNGDGVNDFFTLFGNEDLISIELFQVFNRWGKLVFEGRGWAPNDPTTGWDGFTGGKPAPEGVYVYRSSLLYEDGKTRITSGSFTLIR